MSVQISERAIHDSRYLGSVAVRPDAGRVVIEWYCGDERLFEVSDLRNTIEQLKVLGPMSAWLEVKDANSRPTRAQLIGDDLHVQGSVEAVNFGDLQRAIKLTVKGMKKDR